MTRYLHPTAPIAADALLPTDPAEAMALAQHLIDGPLMANHSHGLWGYSGPTATGSHLTIQATGIGGPSAASVLFELAQHGVRRAIRVGQAIALGEVGEHEPIVVTAALRGDGTSRALGDTDQARPDPELTRSLQAALGGRAREATVLSRDLHDPPAEHSAAHPRAAEALLGDLETAALLAAGEHAGVSVAGVLLVANGNAGVTRERLLDLGSAGVAALAA
jgi:uridine phosphorylase